jgi:ABC-2 type transport system ATP-binding protein
LLGDPEIVILDEPVNGLDVAGIQDMRELIRSLAADHGKTVFLSSHLLSEVQQVCDRVAIINKGEVIREATVAGLLDQETTALRVDAAPPEAAEAVLRPHWPVTRDGAALIVSATRDATPDVARRLVEAGILLFGLAPVQASFEDVFLALTREDPADA